MRQRCFYSFWFAILIPLIIVPATPGQEADDLDAIRREQTKLQQFLDKSERDFNEVMHKQRTEWEMKLKKLEKEKWEVFHKSAKGSRRK